MDATPSTDAARREPDGSGQSCENCGAALNAPYCAQCGQKAVSLNHPALALLRDVLDGFFSVDGKFWRTVVNLYRRPGQTARDFLDGRRALQSPPVRLYVIAALVFVLGFQLSGIALIGIETERGADFSELDADTGEVVELGAGPVNVRLRPFRPPWTPGPEPIDWDAVRALLADAQNVEVDELPDAERMEEEALEAGGVVALAILVGRDPQSAERRANLALNQAVLAMVMLFGVFNILLHPRARLVVHAVHSLYFHAALLPLAMLSAVAAVYVSAVSQIAGGVIGMMGFAAVLVLAWRSDRAVYASSWYGASLRVVVMTLLYNQAFLAIAIGLVLLSID